MSEAQDAHYAEPVPEVRFGDVFAADFMLDAHVRDDALFLGGDRLAGKDLVAKLGRWMNTQGLEAEEIDLFSDVFANAGEAGLILAHASAALFAGGVPRAILVSDDCLAATCLAQGREGRTPGGRLLFAPVREVGAESWSKLSAEETLDFGRFPLPRGEGFECHVAELRHVFAVGAKSLADHLDARVAALADAVALEEHWSAYAARRGPLAYERNTLKLASLLAGGGQGGAGEEEVADSVAEVLDLSWRIEGIGLEQVSEAEERVRLDGVDAAELTPGLRANLAGDLRELSAAAERAADLLAVA